MQPRNHRENLPDSHSSVSSVRVGPSTKTFPNHRSSRNGVTARLYPAVVQLPRESIRSVQRMSDSTKLHEVRLTERLRVDTKRSFLVSFRLMELIWSLLIDEIISQIDTKTAAVSWHENRSNTKSICFSFCFRLEKRAPSSYARLTKAIDSFVDYFTSDDQNLSKETLKTDKYKVRQRWSTASLSNRPSNLFSSSKSYWNISQRTHIRWSSYTTKWDREKERSASSFSFVLSRKNCKNKNASQVEVCRRPDSISESSIVALITTWKKNHSTSKVKAENWAFFRIAEVLSLRFSF